MPTFSLSANVAEPHGHAKRNALGSTFRFSTWINKVRQNMSELHNLLLILPLTHLLLYPSPSGHYTSSEFSHLTQRDIDIPLMRLPRLCIR